MSEKNIPKNIDAEQSVLGAMLIDESVIVEAKALLRREHFHNPTHRFIFWVLGKMHDLGESVDFITVAQAAMKMGSEKDFGGVQYLHALIEACPSVANLASYAKIIRDTYILRQLIVKADKIREKALSGECDASTLLVDAERMILDIGENQTEIEYASGKELMDELRQDILEAVENPGSELGVQTGLTDFDEMTAGLHPGELVIVAGRPAMGKSAMASLLSFNAMRDSGRPVFIFSEEMPKKVWARRIVCAEAKVSARDLSRGTLEKDEWHRVNGVMAEVDELPIYVVDKNGITIEEIRSQSQRMQAAHGSPAVIVVDYIQITDVAGEQRDERLKITHIARSLKNLARSMDCTVIALSQLSRKVEQREDKRPMLSDLRESGAIEDEADVVVFLYRPNYYAAKDGRAADSLDPNTPDEVIIGKQRNGPTGTVPVRFVPEIATFENYQETP